MQRKRKNNLHQLNKGCVVDVVTMFQLLKSIIYFGRQGLRVRQKAGVDPEKDFGKRTFYNPGSDDYFISFFSVLCLISLS